MDAMKISSTRFGQLKIEPADVISFPAGIVGLEGSTHWVLLADADNEILGWLQSTTREELALAVVSPRRFVPDYQVRVSRSELGPLAATPVDDAHVAVIVSKNEGGITLNLKAPVIIDLKRRVGRQVVTNGDYPVQYELSRVQAPLKKIA